MGSMSLVHWLVVLGIALLLFGNRLPGLGKSLGEGIRNFKSGLGNEDGEEGDQANAKSDGQGAKTAQKQISGQSENEASSTKRENSHHHNG